MGKDYSKIIRNQNKENCNEKMKNLNLIKYLYDYQKIIKSNKNVKLSLLKKRMQNSFPQNEKTSFKKNEEKINIKKIEIPFDIINKVKLIKIENSKFHSISFKIDSEVFTKMNIYFMTLSEKKTEKINMKEFYLNPKKNQKFLKGNYVFEKSIFKEIGHYNIKNRSFSLKKIDFDLKKNKFFDDNFGIDKSKNKKIVLVIEFFNLNSKNKSYVKCLKNIFLINKNKFVLFKKVAFFGSKDFLVLNN